MLTERPELQVLLRLKYVFLAFFRHHLKSDSRVNIQVLMQDAGPVLPSEAEPCTEAFRGPRGTCVSEDLISLGCAWLLRAFGISCD